MDNKKTTVLEGVKYYFKAARLDNRNKPRCAIVFVHGLRDHAGTHDFFFQQLAEEGCHILSFDLLGHGYSPGQRCSIKDYQQHVLLVWHSIIRGLREHIPQNIPIIIMGYSYGFSLVVHALAALSGKHRSIDTLMQRRVKLVVGLSPAFKVGHIASPLMRLLSPVLAFLSRHVKNIPFKTMDIRSISDDEEILKVIETDPRVFKGNIGLHTARNVHIAGKTALKLLPTIQLPFLLIFGSEDFVVPVTAEEIHHRQDIQLHIIKGGKHNIFDGDNLYAGRTLESILRAIEGQCG